jgi:hypothetical protein
MTLIIIVIVSVMATDVINALQMWGYTASDERLRSAMVCFKILNGYFVWRSKQTRGMLRWRKRLCVSRLELGTPRRCNVLCMGLSSMVSSYASCVNELGHVCFILIRLWLKEQNKQTVDNKRVVVKRRQTDGKKRFISTWLRRWTLRKDNEILAKIDAL